MAQSPETTDVRLHFKEQNRDGEHTIVFLHGASGGHFEWDAVVAEPPLAPYHLLLVDLPRHSGSHHVVPFSLSGAADEVAKVIRKHGHNGGKAHVVGFSLGGFTALELTARHPDVLLSTFTTGAFPWRGLFKAFGSRPRLMWFLDGVSGVFGLAKAAEQKQGIKLEDHQREKFRQNKSWELTQEVHTGISNDFSDETVQRVAQSGVRVCVVAGSKMDQVDSARATSLILKAGGESKGVTNCAFEIKDGYHPWHLQFPALFASGVKAWVEGEDMPSRFQPL